MSIPIKLTLGRALKGMDQDVSKDRHRQDSKSRSPWTTLKCTAFTHAKLTTMKQVSFLEEKNISCHISVSNPENDVVFISVFRSPSYQTEQDRVSIAAISTISY